METPTTTAPSRSLLKSSSSSSSNSFRLRSQSLNSLRLRRIFDLFDTNHDSLITLDELSRALMLLGLDADMAELDSIIKSYVQDGNDGLTFEDFVALHRSLDNLFFGLEGEDDLETAEAVDHDEEADLTEAFKVFDEDGDGFISAMELQVVLGKLGFAEASEIGRVEMMISSVDRNDDGRVDFSEFKDMMRNVIALK